MPPKRTGKKKKEEDEDAEAKKAEEEQHDWEPVVERLRPKEQLDLTEEELNQEITRVLSANNPNAPQNVIRFSNKERLFKLEPSVEQMATHFNLEGHLLHKDTDEAKRIISQAEAERDEQARKEQEIPLPINQNQQEQQEDNAKTLRNQFNFSERASQTFNNPMRERGTATEPPPSVTFSATATQWEIFDNYEQDLERQRQAKEKKPTHVGKDKTGKEEMLGGDEEESPQQQRQETNVIHSQAMNKALKSMERMVNQNTYDDIAMDYQYWEDVSDSFKEGEGTLLPLWKFYTDKAKRKHVTSICWNTEYNDLFAVGYGSYDFMRQTPGLICCWSLKNPTYPEYTFTTDSGVMCLDFHPQHSSLLAVGLYDGTVLIYDIRHRLNKPIFQSTVKTGKHTDPVWQVCWQEEDLAKNSNFFSISSDGRVSLWTMSKNELQCTDVMELKLVGIQKEGSSGSAEEGEEETSLCGLAGGTCFDFNRTSDHLFIVGTEEGKIHKCSKAYNSQYLETYEGHTMAVYSVRWNSFHPRVFLSASADWTVKVWDHSTRTPVMSFDLANAVGDCAWSPYSASTFAAVTNDGKVHVFDLNENKHEAMCSQKVVRKAKLCHICFNPKEPLLLVGDDRGCVSSLKLSPNLRKSTKVEKRETRPGGGPPGPPGGPPGGGPPGGGPPGGGPPGGGPPPGAPGGPPGGPPGAPGAEGAAAVVEKPKTFQDTEIDKLEKILSLNEGKEAPMK